MRTPEKKIYNKNPVLSNKTVRVPLLYIILLITNILHTIQGTKRTFSLFVPS